MKELKRGSKGYSAETLRKVTADLRERVWYYAEQLRNGVMMKLSISAGNRKIGRVWNISLAPVISCGNCAECSHFCYAVGSVIAYHTAAAAWSKNLAILQHDRDGYFAQLDAKMSSRTKRRFFRFHVSGEIPDVDYLRRMIELARKHPDWKIWTYTKMYGIVNSYCRTYGKVSIPENLVIMFSEWKGTPIINPYGFPEFRVIFPGDVDQQEQIWTCPGNCEICIEAGRGCVAGETSKVKLHR